MNPSTFTTSQIVRFMGPVGLIGANGAVKASFSVAPDPQPGEDPNHPRTFRINFLTPDGKSPLVLNLNGTYTLTLGPNILSQAGDPMDTNENAGLDILRQTPSAGTSPVTYNATDTPVTINAGQTIKSTINITDNYLVQGITLQLNITYPHDPDLQAILIGPNNQSVTLFSGIGANGNQQNFTNTVFDDAASTPIEGGTPPFAGRFNPLQPLSVFSGGVLSASGTWTLEIIDSSTGTTTGTLNSWSLMLLKPVSASGLGEPVADQATVSFRIFTMDPSNPLSSSTWTSVGPGADSTGHGRIGGIAVDPSDPSGNTVYVAGASGGVWKTTDFLTTASGGPTYIPLTDFGPTFGINIGGLAVFGRNNDTTQSIVFAATGEGDTGTQGVGFLRSMDGGATWTLLDSSTNVDANGNILPLNSNARDHIFAGTTSFKVLVDPNPTPSGNVIVYAALAGANGGIWRSTDTGNHWTLMRAGSATDIVFDPNSGHINSINNPTGNLDVLYAAFAGDGVYVTPNRGQVWTQLLGGVGDPTIFSGDSFPPKNVPVAAPGGTPNGAKGRIVLAKPFLTGNPAKDLLYEGWLYALVVASSGHLDGLYLTKDFGQNWTKVGIPTVGTTQTGVQNAIPTNDATQPNYDVFGGAQFTQGNYDVSLGIDPINPNIVYLGGTADGQPTGFIRVDTTGLSDPHALFLGNNKNGGQLRTLTGDPVTLDQWPNGTTGQVFGSFNPFDEPYINLIRNPSDIFGSPQVTVYNTAQFTNTGTGATWTPFDIGGTDQHRIVTLVDPLTGQARLIIGDDQGIYSALDINGELSTGIVQGQTETGGGAADRNGNLDIAQFYYGASQPSDAAAQIAAVRGLFYTGVQDGATNVSDLNVLNNGNLAWTNNDVGDSAGIATDQTGSGTLYQYIWPCCGGNITDFFQVNGTGRTFGLIQKSGGTPVPDPQWPFTGGVNFAVNPIDGSQIIIGSTAGRIFSTADQGQTWFVIADPTVLDGTQALAMAYGAPDPNDPSGALNDFLYVGTNGGHIYVTFDGGGANGNDWINLSAGLDGSTIQSIVTNPNRGSHEAYAVTSKGVYHMVDATVAGAKWVNITGNLFQITHNLFTPFNDSTQLVGPQLASLTSIQADWRYAIPVGSGNLPPILYVGGQGGVFRSEDGGQSWTSFPNSADDNAPQDGGFLPNADVTDLQLATGNIDPTTGRPDQTTGPDVLLATTYGRGAFAIRVAPVIISNSVQLDPNRPAPGGSISGPNKNATTTNVLQPVFDGMSELNAFGNTIKIQLFDLTNGLVNPPEIGFDPANPGNNFVTTDSNGRFFIQVMSGYFKADGSTDGPKLVGLQATDGAGAVGPMVTFKWTLNTTPFIHDLPNDPNSPHLDANGPLPASQGGSDSGLSFTDKITNVTQPIFDGLLDQSAPTLVTLTENGTIIGSGMTNANGTFSIQIQPGVYGPGGKFADGLQTISIVAPHGGLPSNTVIFTFTEVTVAPPTPGAPSLLPASDSGFSNSDHNTSVTQPTFSGSGQTNAFGPTIVLLYANGVLVGSDTLSGLGQYDVTVSPGSLVDGTYNMKVRLEDVAGNISGVSLAMKPPLIISTKPPGAPSIKLDPGYNTGPANEVPPQTAVIPQLFDGTSDPNTNVQIFDNGVVIDSFSMGGAVSFSRLENLADGDHVLTVVATNVAGNTATFAPPQPDGKIGYEVVVNPTALDKDLLLVRALYFQDLGRAGTLPEWQGWLPTLAMPNGRFLVDNAIERSPEARDDQVIGLYQTYLGRKPGNGEELGWVNQLLAGATLESVQAGILGSGEYFNRTPGIVGVAGPASNTTFVEALYSQLLSRTPSPAEVNGWLGVVASSGRTFVAATFLGSAEYRADVVTSYYLSVLRRPTLPSAGEVNGWVNSGLDLISILIQFEASPEYFFRVTGFQP
jgi:subtilisin-like proprotein convertase family protein